MNTTILYKLTDKNYRTDNDTQWGEGIKRRAFGKGPIYGSGWIHAYTHPLLAVLLNPGHADIKNPIVWEAHGVVGIEDYGLRVGCRRLKTIKIISMPEVTTEQRVRFGILCTLEVCTEPSFVSWAHKWLSGEDRSEKAAEAAVNAATEAAEWAARAARDAAKEAAFAVNAAAALAAAYAAVWAARAARAAADAAYWAAWWAARSGKNIDLIALAIQATLPQVTGV